MDIEYRQTILPKIDPAYITNDAAYEFLEKINKTIKDDFDSSEIFSISVERKSGLPHLMYKSFLDLTLINTVLEKGQRVVHYGDQVLNEYQIPAMFKEQRDILFPELIVQDEYSSNPKKKKLLEGLLNIIEEKEGNLKFPFLVNGLSIENSVDKDGFGARLMPRGNNLENLNLYYSDDLKYRRSNIDRFSDLDKDGLPIRNGNGTIGISLKKSGTAVLSTNNKLMFDAGYGSVTSKGSSSPVIIVRNRPKYTGEKIIK